MEKIKVIWKDTADVACEKEFDGLGPAMDWAKILDKFVTISGPGLEVIGKFGVDSVENGLLPNGTAYTWMKRRK